MHQTCLLYCFSHIKKYMFLLFFLYFGGNLSIKRKTIFIQSHITYAVFPDFLNVTFLETDPEKNSWNIVINMNSTENIQQTKSSVYWIMYTRLNIPFSFLYSLKQYWRRSKHVRKGRGNRVRKKNTVGSKIREGLGRNI